MLIVEDEPALARLYRAYLEDEQIDLEHVDTGKAAISQCDGNILQAARLLEINPSTIYRKKAGWDPNATA